MSLSLKAGDVLVPREGTAWASLWRSIELVSSARSNNLTYWWVKMENKLGAKHFDTLNYGIISAGFEKKADFFELGKKYQFSHGVTRDTYEIIELHQVDRAIDRDHERAALAKCHDAISGKVYLTVLIQPDFESMVKL